MPHPADGVQLAPVEGGIEIERSDGVVHESGPPIGLGGSWAFWDGSASRHPVAELRRAAWAVAYVDDAGSTQAVITGPVWRNLPQSPQASEHIGAVAAIQTLSLPTRLVGDCLGVVKAVSQLSIDFLPKGAYAGVFHDVKDEAAMSKVVECKWFPSHTTLSPSASEEERILHAGNDLVDKRAAETRIAIETELGNDILVSAEADCKLAVKVLKALGDVLSQWPAIPRCLERRVEQHMPKLKIVHDWVYVPLLTYWRCKACKCFHHGSLETGPPADTGWCRPGRVFEREMKAFQLGHDLAACSRAGTKLTYCRACGAHGSWRWNLLLSPCTMTPKSAQGQMWLHKVKTTGTAPVQLSRKQGAGTQKRAKRKTPKKSPALSSRPEKSNFHDPLRNKAHADADTKAKWAPGLKLNMPRPSYDLDSQLLAAAGAEPALAQSTRRTLSTNGEQAQTADGDPERGPACPDEQDAPALAETSCEGCAATILDTDVACANCGRPRPSSQTKPDQPEPSATPLPWHGGTLTPPPLCLATENGPRARETREKPPPKTTTATATHKAASTLDDSEAELEDEETEGAQQQPTTPEGTQKSQGLEAARLPAGISAALLERIRARQAAVNPR